MFVVDKSSMMCIGCKQSTSIILVVALVPLVIYDKQIVLSICKHLGFNNSEMKISLLSLLLSNLKFTIQLIYRLCSRFVKIVPTLGPHLLVCMNILD